MIDLDSFLPLIVEQPLPQPPELLMCLPKNEIDVMRVVTLYSVIRSSLVATGAVPKDYSDALFRDWRRATLMYSVKYAADGIPAAQLPDWTAIIKDRVLDKLQESYPKLRDVVIVPSLDHRIYAWSAPSARRINISLTTRHYLLAINVIIFNAIFSTLEEAQPNQTVYEPPISVIESILNGSNEWLEAGSALLPTYLFSLFFDCNVSALPSPRPIDSNVYRMASRITQIQLEFMIAHEFGHFCLSEEGYSPLEVERRCDDFAREVLGEDVGNRGWIFLSARWLFRLMALERLTGHLLYKESINLNDIDWDQGEIYGRMWSPVAESWFVADEIDPESNVLDALGTAFLIRIKASLRKDHSQISRIFDEIKIKFAVPTTKEFYMNLIEAMLGLTDPTTKQTSYTNPFFKRKVL